MRQNAKYIFILIIFSLMLVACATKPPDNPANACNIFEQYPKWYWAAKDSQDKWGVPVSVQLAIIFQESSFKQSVKPPREKILWIIPWKRPTSAVGYTQAIDSTWNNYIIHTGNSSASRKDFADATDFIGWYGYQAYKQAGIPRTSAYDLYLAYHEGVKGYVRGTYKKQKWLMDVAHKVQSNAWRYQKQLAGCADKFKKPWWHFW